MTSSRCKPRFKRMVYDSNSNHIILLVYGWFFHFWHINYDYYSAYSVISVVFSQLWLMFYRHSAVMYVSRLVQVNFSCLIQMLNGKLACFLPLCHLVDETNVILMFVTEHVSFTGGTICLNVVILSDRFMYHIGR